MVSDYHRSAAGMCLVTVDLCPGGVLGDDESSFIHSFILETYIAPLQETTTQRSEL